MQYRLAVNFGTLSILNKRDFYPTETTGTRERIVGGGEDVVAPVLVIQGRQTAPSISSPDTQALLQTF